jgi:hypothetical protein
VKQGSLLKIPLKPGVKAALQLGFSRQVQIETGALAESSFRVSGGLCGVVIDARGRPIKLSADPAKRGQLLQNWNAIIKEP